MVNSKQFNYTLIVITNKYKPELLLILLAASVPLSFATWQTLLDNFAIHHANFTGREIGILQSIREIPGFLAFAVIWVLLIIAEQRLAYLMLILLGIGTAATGFFPYAIGLYAITLLSSLGFHYYETLQTSLALQWLDKDKAPEILGRMISAGAFTSILAFGLCALADSIFNFQIKTIYIIGGLSTVGIAAFCWIYFPTFSAKVTQHKKLILRKRYGLYYALVFMSGARRQIFVVFAGFLMVEKFGFSVTHIAALFLINALINIWIAPKIGRLIIRFGERNALIFEYLGLIGVFLAYAMVESPTVAAMLYIIDHFFFALALAIKTYFQKIADPADIAATAGISFTINHIVAVALPVLYGMLWLISPPMVFISGALLAGVSLMLALFVPRHPEPGNEFLYFRKPLFQKG